MHWYKLTKSYRLWVCLTNHYHSVLILMCFLMSRTNMVAMVHRLWTCGQIDGISTYRNHKEITVYLWWLTHQKTKCELINFWRILTSYTKITTTINMHWSQNSYPEGGISRTTITMIHCDISHDSLQLWHQSCSSYWLVSHFSHHSLCWYHLHSTLPKNKSLSFLSFSDIHLSCHYAIHTFHAAMKARLYRAHQFAAILLSSHRSRELHWQQGMSMLLVNGFNLLFFSFFKYAICIQII